METPNTDMLRGRVDIFVLKALSENHGYGYDILNYIYTRTSGHYEMKQSSIYSVLKRLEKQGYVYSYEGGAETNGAQRRYYALTENGKKLLADQENEWAYTRTLLDNLVSNREFDLQSDTPPFRPSDLRPMTRRSPKAETADAEDAAETTVESTVNLQPSVVTETAPTAVTVQPTSTETVAAQVVIEETIVQQQTYDNVETPQTPIEPVVEQAPTQEHVHVEPTVVPQPAQEPVISEQQPIEPIVEPRQEQTTSEVSAETAMQEDDVAVSTSAPRFSNEELEQLWQSLTRRTPETETSEPQQETAATVSADVVDDTPIEPRENYRDFYGNLYSRQSERRTSESPRPAPAVDELNCSHINDLRIKLNAEGIKLKPYEAATAHKGLLKYVLVNKLLRDATILSYLFLVAMLLIVYLCKQFQVSLNAFFIIGGLGLIAPITGLLIFFNNPLKKKKDNINIKIILSIVGIVYFTVFVISIVANLLIPNDLSLNSYATYAPCIVALVIPFFGAVFTVLYKTKNYHLNTK